MKQVRVNKLEGHYTIKIVDRLPKTGNSNILYAILDDSNEEKLTFKSFYRWNIFINDYDVIDNSSNSIIIEKTSDISLNDGSDGTSAYVEQDELTTVAFTGDYSDLNGTPDLSDYATLTNDHTFNGNISFSQPVNLNNLSLFSNNINTSLSSTSQRFLFARLFNGNNSKFGFDENGFVINTVAATSINDAYITTDLIGGSSTFQLPNVSNLPNRTATLASEEYVQDYVTNNSGGASSLEGVSSTGTVSDGDLIMFVGDVNQTQESWIKFDLQLETVTIGASSLSFTNGASFNNNIASNMGNPILPNDGVNLNYLETYVSNNAGTIANADEEDITIVNDELKLKDRESNVNGQKGYKIIREDFDFSAIPSNYANCIWELRYDYNLNNQIITIPSGVVLKFNGGFLSNYANIIGNKTLIDADVLEIFKGNGNLTGTWEDVSFFPQWFGAKADGITDDTVALVKLQATPASTLEFPKGIYRGNLPNATSNRTFIFKEGSIIDGVAHIATGTGPDYNYNGTNIEWVDDIRIIGTLTATVRIGTYYARRLNADKFKIAEISSSYLNQTADGGSRGVHLYHGSKDFNIGEIIVESTVQALYALGIDTGVTVDDDHRCENINIGRLIVRNNTETVITSANSVNTYIGEVIAYSHGGIGTGFVHTQDKNFKIGRCIVDSSNTPSSTDTVVVNTGAEVSYDYLEINNAKLRGIRVAVGGHLNAKHVKINGAVSDAVRFAGNGNIELLEVNNAPTGLNIENTSSEVVIGKAYAQGCNLGFVVSAPNVRITELSAKNSNTYGLVLNAGATDFYNKYLDIDGGIQGVRCLSPGAVSMGIMKIINCTTGFAGGGMNKFSYEAVYYDGNGTNSNTDFTGLAGFKGSLFKDKGVENIRGDADVTIDMGTGAKNQIFGTSLTADRTVTLSTTNANYGDTIRFVRYAGGSFNLNIGGIKTLAANQYCTIMWSGFTYRLLEFGDL